MDIKDIKIKLKDRLFGILNDNGITTNYKLSKKIGIDESRIGKVKRGNEKLSMNLFLKICDSCNIEIDLKSRHPKAKKNNIILLNYNSIIANLFQAA